MILKYQFLYMNENISVNLRTVNAEMSKQTKFIERRAYLSLQVSVFLSLKRWVLLHSVHGDQIRHDTGFKILQDLGFSGATLNWVKNVSVTDWMFVPRPTNSMLNPQTSLWLYLEMVDSNEVIKVEWGHKLHWSHRTGIFWCLPCLPLPMPCTTQIHLSIHVQGLGPPMYQRSSYSGETQ